MNQHTNYSSLHPMVIKTVAEKNANILALSHLRYETLRKLPVIKFIEVNNRTLQGERFDDIIDELVLLDLI